MRKNDPDDLRRSFFRSIDRFFQINGQWYFSAREGEIGPFRTRQQAQREARAYINARLRADAPPLDPQSVDPRVIPGYVYRSVLSLEQRVSGERDLVLEFED